MSALHPHLRLSVQLEEVARRHRGLGRREARARAVAMLERVRMPDPERRVHAFPHELSGGQRQRATIAAALMAQPELLVADEPTTALDATVQAEVLELIRGLCRSDGLSCLPITHDFGAVARAADEVVVMRAGRVVERGPAARLLTAPEHPYTRALVAATPRLDAAPPKASAPGGPLLELRDLRVRYSLGRGRVMEAVRGVSLGVDEGEALGVVGESGSGKSSLAHALLRLAPVSEGRVIWRGRDVTDVPEAVFRPLRREMQMVFQDPHASLSPRMRVRDCVAEPLLTHAPGMGRAEREDRAAEALAQVGLAPALAGRFPHEVSGGQAQRVGMARALVTGPRLLVCDEAVSALDVSVQSEVLTWPAYLRARLRLALLVITHDLAVVRQVCERVLVMEDGRACETLPAARLTESTHPTTRRLVAAARPPLAAWAPRRPSSRATWPSPGCRRATRDALHLARLVVDTVAIAHHARRRGTSAAAHLCRRGGPIPVWGGEGARDAGEAALLNGAAAEALDYQEVPIDGRNNGHAAVVTVPALAALAAREGVGADRLLPALRAAFAANVVLARALGRGHRTGECGFRTSSLTAPVAAALGGAALPGLGEAAATHAVGIAAASLPAGLRAAMAPGGGGHTEDRDLSVGPSARHAVEAVDLARAGLRGPPDALAGSRGWLASHGMGDADPAAPAGTRPRSSSPPTRSSASRPTSAASARSASRSRWPPRRARSPRSSCG